MVKLYHGTSLDNYEDILNEGLREHSWLTLEYEDASGYVIDKDNLDKGIIICFDIPTEVFEEYLEIDGYHSDCIDETMNYTYIKIPNYEQTEHFITKKVLPKEFIVSDEYEIFEIIC